MTVSMRRLALLSLLLLPAACSSPTLPPDAPATAAATPAGTGSAAPAAISASDYVIGSGDQLSIFVYDSPQLSTEVPVRPDGRISTPLLSDIQASGKTPAQLSKEIAERLKEFVRDPNVTVIVRGFIGPLDRQVRVIGEAADPQALPYRDGMTLLDVMITTKGLTKFAAGNRAVIVRKVDGKDVTIHVHLADLIKDGDISQNVAMQPGDTLIIPQTWF